MSTKFILYWLLILLVAANMPGIALAQGKNGSTTPTQENKPSADASKKTTDSLKVSTPKNPHSSSAEKKAAPETAKGEILKGKVVYITDGDTLTLQVDKKQYKIRLLGIDAPEVEQPFGKQATKALSDKVFEKTVQVTTYGKDIYGNTLGIVNLDGKNINLELVKEGFAWHYKEYSASKTLANAEDEARKAKIGLWADENPIPPWQWRQQTNADNSEDPFDAKANNPNTPKTTKSPADQTQNYWLTASSNVRHNSKCRNYQKTKGRACGPGEGTPCKVCGG
ncbi:MAG: thermonuclease family protein [Thermoguttaceae bacterium]